MPDDGQAEVFVGFIWTSILWSIEFLGDQHGDVQQRETVAKLYLMLLH